MSCLLCASNHQAEFSAEMMIHLTSFKHLDQTDVLLFPKLLLCLDCGFAQFTATHDTLAQLAKPAAQSEAARR
jgi:hypothetical protein